MATPVRITVLDDHRLTAELLGCALESRGYVTTTISERPLDELPETDVVLIASRAAIGWCQPDDDTVVVVLDEVADGSPSLVGAHIASKHASIEQLDALIDAAVSDPRSNVAQLAPRLGRRRGMVHHDGLDRLTGRERQVLALLARGLGMRAIAAELDVSYATVRSHTQNVLLKLDAHSQIEAVRLAFAAAAVS